MPSITVVPFGGLGNRLRVLQSALQISKDSKTTIKLLWFKKAELYAHFFELFDTKEKTLEEVRGLKYRFSKTFLKHIYTVKYPKVYKFLLSLIYDCVLLDEDVLKLDQEVLIARIRSAKRVFLATCYQFHAFEDYNSFQPIKPIRDLATDFMNKNSPWKSISGVHIRRTDHIDIQNLGGVELYRKIMDRILTSDSNRRFLICSDDQGVKDELKADYGSTVLIREVELGRTSETGMSEALVDILLLSKCESLIGSARSSFVTLAQQIGSKKELIDIENV